MNDSEKNAVLFLRIAQDLKVTEATIAAETAETLYNLIIRQHEKIDRLNIDLKAMRGAANSWKAEIERICKKEFDNIEIDIETVKSEAVREFAEKLKEYCNEIANQEWNKRTLPVSWADAYKDFIDDIDQLLEEMGVQRWLNTKT